MYCWNCGTQLPDNANFCSKCGKQQKPGEQPIEPNLKEEKWETCEILFDSQYQLGRGWIFWFWAKAIGPEGEYSAGSSGQLLAGPIFDKPNSDNRETKMAHSELVAKLVSDGWEPVPNKGSNWWNDRFRRRVRAIQAATSQLPSDSEEDLLMRAIRPYYPHADPSWLMIDRIRRVRDYLSTGEIPEGVIFAQHPKTGVGGGGLWATNKRLYVGTTFLEKPVVEEYPYDKISAIESSADGSVISIQCAGKKVALKGVDKRALLVSFLNLVRKKMGNR